jgi:hypothetical protein
MNGKRIFFEKIVWAGGNAQMSGEKSAPRQPREVPGIISPASDDSILEKKLESQVFIRG